MKPHHLLAALLAALPLVAGAQTVTTAVPGFISYQGRVLDLAGAPVGVGVPVNRTVIFRIWDHPSNTADANLIYSEQQTVTISEGEFSVLVGQGVATAGSQFGFSETPKGPPSGLIVNAFQGSGRYLGVTIDDGTAAVDNEITPRQQIVTSAFAFRARFAETLGTSAGTALNVLDNGHIGIGNTQPPSLFTITGSNNSTSTSTPQLLITDSGDPNERLRIGLDSTGNGRGFIQSFKEGTGATSLLLNPNGGFVGIGTVNPETALDVAGGIRAGASVAGSLNGYTFRSPGETDGGMFSSADGLIEFRTDNTERMRINNAGNVGIGATNPMASLGYPSDWRGLHLQVPANALVAVQGTASARLHLRCDGNTINLTRDFTMDNVDNRVNFRWLGSGLSNRLDIMTMLSNGYVGIGTDAPGSSLQVNGGIRARGGLPGGGGVSNNGYAFTGNSGDNDTGMFSSADGTLQLVTNAVERLRINESGRVGIGTNSPVYPLEVAGGNQYNYTSAPLFDYATGHPGAGLVRQTGTRTVGIYSHNWIAAGGFVAISDSRVKDVVARTEGACELDRIQKLKVTDYRMKDVVGHGTQTHQGFLAQEVVEIMPEAVLKSRGFVPDVYAMAAEVRIDFRERIATIRMAKPHALHAGDLVRLHSEERMQDRKVVGVVDELTFQVEDFDGDPARVFVFGREVDDFHQLDYNRIFTTGIAALQELKREKDREVEDLRHKLLEQERKLEEQDLRLAELEARDSARAKRLAALEEILLPKEKAVVASKSGVSAGGQE